jgi:hypothetical protein
MPHNDLKKTRDKGPNKTPPKSSTHHDVSLKVPHKNLRDSGRKEARKPIHKTPTTPSKTSAIKKSKDTTQRTSTQRPSTKINTLPTQKKSVSTSKKTSTSQKSKTAKKIATVKGYIAKKTDESKQKGSPSKYSTSPKKKSPPKEVRSGEIKKQQPKSTSSTKKEADKPEPAVIKPKSATPQKLQTVEKKPPVLKKPSDPLYDPTNAPSVSKGIPKTPSLIVTPKNNITPGAIDGNSKIKFSAIPPDMKQMGLTNAFKGVEREVQKIQHDTRIDDITKLSKILAIRKAQNYLLESMDSVESFHFLFSKKNSFAFGHRNVVIGNVRGFLSREARNGESKRQGLTPVSTLDKFDACTLDKPLLDNIKKFQTNILGSKVLQQKYLQRELTEAEKEGVTRERNQGVLGRFTFRCMFPKFKADQRDSDFDGNPNQKGAHVSSELLTRMGFPLLFKVEDDIDELDKSQPKNKKLIAEIRSRQSGWFRQRNTDMQYDEIIAARAYLIEGIEAPLMKMVKDGLNRYFAQHPDPEYTKLDHRNTFFSSEVTKAIMLFQRRQGLEPDGIVGYQTLEDLLPGWKYSYKSTNFGRHGRLSYQDSVISNDVKIPRVWLNEFATSKSAGDLFAIAEGMDNPSQACQITFPWPRKDRQRGTGSTGITVAAGFDVGQYSRSQIDRYFKAAGWESWFNKPEEDQQYFADKQQAKRILYASIGAKGLAANRIWKQNREFFREFKFPERLVKNLFNIVVEDHRDMAADLYNKWATNKPDGERKTFDQLSPLFQITLTDLRLRGDLVLRDEKFNSAQAFFEKAMDNDLRGGYEILTDRKYFPNAHATVQRRVKLRAALLAVALDEQKKGINHLNSMHLPR